MSRNKPAQAGAEDVNDAHDAAAAHAQPGSEPATTAQAGAAKSKWVSRFGSFKDVQAGVHLVEDRVNKRMTIQFDEKPSDAVLALVKAEPNRFRYDGEERLWYKPISQATPASSRDQARDLAFDVANMIRAEKGLEHKDYGRSM